MKILILSCNDINKDGRLVELINIYRDIGDVYYICRSSDSKTVIDDEKILLGNDQSTSTLGYLRFLDKWVKRIYSDRFEMIVADNRNCLIPAVYLKNKVGARILSYDAREMYMFKEVKHLHGKMGCIVEDILVNKFEVITCANSFRAQIMKEHFKLGFMPIVYENIRQLEYGVGEEERCEDALNHYFVNNKVYIISTSGVLKQRNAHVLCDAIARLGEDYHLFIIGYSDEDGQKMIEMIKNKYGVSNITVLKWMNKNELKYMIGHCQIGIVNYSQEGTNNRFCASGKMYEFAFEGLPMVTTSNPPLTYFCETYGIGVSDDSFYDGIREIMKDYSTYKNNVLKFAKGIDVGRNNTIVADSIKERLCSLETI